MPWWVLKRKIHTSWLIAVCCSGIFIGVYLAQFRISQYFSSIICFFLATMTIIIVLWRKNIYLIPFLIVGGILLGLWRGTISQIDLSQINPYYGKAIYIEGIVKDDVDIGSSGQMVIRLDKLMIDKKSISGVLWVSAGSADVKRGDKVVLYGQLLKGFGNFSGMIYRAEIKTVVHPIPGDIARAIRDWFTTGVKIAIPEPESSLGIGYLVGQRRALPLDLVVALQAAGLTHIVVASGYNLTILVRLARRLFVKISKYLSALSASIMIVSFIAVTGLSPSMSRAGLVSGLSLAAWYYGRKFHPIVLLLSVMALTVIINPSYAWGDLGWQLSFAAFAGVMIIAPLAQRYLFGDKKPGFIGQVLGETVSAQLATAPIIALAFGQLSNVAIISNLLILPLVPLAMLLTFIAGIFGLLWPAIATAIGIPANILLRYMITVAEYLASLPWAVSTVEIKGWMIGLYYLVIIGLCIFMWRKTKYNLRDTNLVE